MSFKKILQFIMLTTICTNAVLLTSSCVKEHSIRNEDYVYLPTEEYNYYHNSINGLGGLSLVNNLSDLITKTHKARNYYDSWSVISSFTDNFYHKDGKIVDIYSTKTKSPSPYQFTPISDEKHTSEKVKKTKKEGESYNREHLIPQSWFKKNQPMVGDAHHIFPTDVKVNMYRSNFIHDNVTTLTRETQNGSKLGKNWENITVFEPIDDFKGDIARSYFYFAIRYFKKILQNQNWVIIENAFPYINDKYLNNYLKWNDLDPIDAFDKYRNKQIYAYQNNRNPFIDIPILSSLIWNKQYWNHKLIIKKLN